MTSALEHVETLTAIVPDFPIPGIPFRDLTPVFADPGAFRAVIDELVASVPTGFDAVAGIEARGFALASAAAYASGTGLLLVRKEGKLPRATLRQEYALEYGQATLELHPDDLEPGSRVLLLDDVLATGGTLAASVELLRQAQLEVVGCGVIVELGGLAGRAKLGGLPLHAVQTLG